MFKKLRVLTFNGASLRAIAKQSRKTFTGLLRRRCLLAMTVLILSMLINLSSTLLKANADEVSLTVTPVKLISSATRQDIHEGDEFEFKIVEDSGQFKKGDILTGTIMMYDPNGFQGKSAKATIGNFRTSTGKSIKGEIYVSGNEHAMFQESSNLVFSSLFMYVRGGEIIVKPDKDTLTFFTEE